MPSHEAINFCDHCVDFSNVRLVRYNNGFYILKMSENTTDRGSPSQWSVGEQGSTSSGDHSVFADDVENPDRSPDSSDEELSNDDGENEDTDDKGIDDEDDNAKEDHIQNYNKIKHPLPETTLPAQVRILMDSDAILTDEDIVNSDNYAAEEQPIINKSSNNQPINDPIARLPAITQPAQSATAEPDYTQPSNQSGIPQPSIGQINIDQPRTEEPNLSNARNPMPPPPVPPRSDDRLFRIPANPYAHAYQSKGLGSLLKRRVLPQPFEEHFKYLNCSYLSHNSNVKGPTIVQLKQHVQALCLLLRYMQSGESTSWPNMISAAPFPPSFSFLDDLEKPYEVKGSKEIPDFHLRPLPSLNNQIPRPDLVLPENLSRDELLVTTNILLTRLDFLYSSDGGILGIPDPIHPLSDKENNSNSAPGYHRNAPHFGQPAIFAQWLTHTRNLTQRLSALEAETASLREVLAHESLIPLVRARQERDQNGVPSSGRELVLPQDRYVLSSLSDGLWTRLNEELSARASENADEPRDCFSATVNRGVGNFTVLEDSESAGEKNVVTWIECASRLYRIQGHETIFVIPGFDLHPGAEAVRRIERGPLVQSVPEKRLLGKEWTSAGATAWERQMTQDSWKLQGEIVGLRGQVAHLKIELEAERFGRKKAEEEAERKGRREWLREKTEVKGKGSGMGDLSQTRKPLGGIKDPLGRRRKPLGETRELLGGIRRPLGEIREPSDRTREPLGVIREPLDRTRRPSGESREPLSEIREPSDEIREPSTERTDPARSMKRKREDGLPRSDGEES